MRVDPRTRVAPTHQAADSDIERGHTLVTLRAGGGADVYVGPDLDGLPLGTRWKNSRGPVSPRVGIKAQRHCETTAGTFHVSSGRQAVWAL